MKVTDEMATKACEVYYGCFKLNGKLNPLAMKAALEAAFASIPEKPDNSKELKPGEYDWRNLNFGLYKIYWKDGSCSLASIGNLYSGRRWFAPCNWTSENHNVASSSWDMVKDVKLIMSTSQIDRDEEPDNSIFNSFPPEAPTMPEDNQDGWVDFKGHIKTPINIPIEVKYNDGEILEFSSSAIVNWNNINLTHYRIKPNTVKPERKKRADTLLEWLRNQNVGQPNYQWTEREKAMFAKLSQYFRYLEGI